MWLKKCNNWNIFPGTDLANLNFLWNKISYDWLRKLSAIIENDVVINVSSIFGGTEIYIPDNVKVKIRSTSIFGGVDEKKVNSIEGKEVHTIYINATCIFGGVEIKWQQLKK